MLTGCYWHFVDVGISCGDPFYHQDIGFFLSSQALDITPKVYPTSATALHPGKLT